MAKFAVFLAFTVIAIAFASNSIAQQEYSYSIYGKVLDENNNPVENETVTAEWNESGKTKSAYTKTLTLEEAKSLGNEDLAGTYIFQKNEIKMQEHSDITIKTQPRVVYSKITPQETSPIEAPTIKIPGVSVKLRENEKRNLLKNAAIAIFSFLKNAVIKTYWIALILAAGYFGYNNVYKKLKKKIDLRKTANYTLAKEIGSLHETAVKEIMVKKPIAVQKDAGILETLETMITGAVNCVIVMDKKKPVGIVSECDFLKKVYTLDKIEPLKISSIMSSPIKSLEPDATIAEIIEFCSKNRIRRVPIIKNGKLHGIVSISDILRKYGEFFSKNVIEANFMPSAKDIMATEISEIDDEARLSDVISYMVWKNTGYTMVFSGQKESYDERMVTSGDMLNQFYKSLKEMYHLKLKQITTTPVIFVKKEASIIDACEMMQKNGFRRLPVTSESKVIGIVTQIALAKAIYDFANGIGHTSKV